MSLLCYLGWSIWLMIFANDIVLVDEMRAWINVIWSYGDETLESWGFRLTRSKKNISSANSVNNWSETIVLWYYVGERYPSIISLGTWVLLSKRMDRSISVIGFKLTSWNRA